MLYIGFALVLVVLFALCVTQDKALDQERNFRIQYRQVSNSSQHDH
jgi:hypothetical protein